MKMDKTLPPKLRKKPYHHSLQSIHEHPNAYHDDQYTVADSASTSFSMHSNFTTGTDYPSLSRLSKASFKLRSTSSFPSILNLYDQPIEEESPDLIIKRDPNGRKKRRNQQKAKTDFEALIETRNRQEQRTIKIEAIVRDQMDKYDKYIKRLKDKVEKQREDRKQRHEEILERLKENEKEEKKHSKALKRPKMVYVHDRKYLKKLPKSNLRKMVIICDELSRRGMLKNREDVDKFWNEFPKSNHNEVDVLSRKSIQEVQESNSISPWKKPEVSFKTTPHVNRNNLPPLGKKKKKKTKVLEGTPDLPVAKKSSKEKANPDDEND